MGLFLGSLGHRLLRQPMAVIIGGMCYTIYLYHFMIIDLIAPWTMRLASPAHSIPADLILQCLLMVPPVLLVSVVIFVLVERPCMRLSAGFISGFRRPLGLAVTESDRLSPGLDSRR